MAMAVEELTKYQKITGVYPDSNSSISFTHSLGVVPKFIVVKNENDQYSTTVKDFYFLADGFCGGSTYYNSNNVLTAHGFLFASGVTSSDQAKYYFDASGGIISKFSNAIKWDTNSSYSIEVYA